MLENPTDTEFDYFSIELAILDKDGTQIDTAYADVNNWKPGKKAKFEFYVGSEEYASYEIADFDYSEK